MEGERERRVLSIEKRLNNIEQRKDSQVLAEIAADLPSAARIKIYKVSDLDGSRVYITAIAAEILTRKDIHQFLQSRFGRRHGGGTYILEFLNSEGDPVKEHEISILVEDDTSEKREILEEKERLLQKEKAMKTEEASATATLLSAVVPLIQNKEDSIEKFSKLLEISNQLKQGGGIQAIIKNQETITTLKEVLGGKDEDVFTMIFKLKALESLSPTDSKQQRNFFEELISSPEKIESIRRLLGIEQREPAVPAPVATKSGFDEIVDIAGKFNVIEPFMKKLFGTPNPPPKSFMEFLATAISAVSPHLPNVTEKIMSGLTQIASLKAQAYTAALQLRQQGILPIKKRKPVDFCGMFDNVVAEFVESSSGEVQPDEFTDVIADRLKRLIQKNPSIMNIIWDKESMLERLSRLLVQRLGIMHDTASQYLTDILQKAGLIMEEVKNEQR
ncbi:MAG: hypothetical protein AB1478_09075 [Nitrospirota bacterium]